MNIIEELYYKNIDPDNMSLDWNPDYSNALMRISDREDLLEESLTGNDKQLFLQLTDAYSEAMGTASVENFMTGFRLGVRFFLDACFTQPDFRKPNSKRPV